MKFKDWLFFLGILLISIAVRFYGLSRVPVGLNIDEASQGYNAYSLLLTGKDRYGEVAPILFRSFGSFQPPIYTYLTTLPIKFFGPSIFSIHFVSAVCGVVSVLVTFFIVFLLTKNISLSLITMLVLGLSPWSVFFSRMATEASTGICFFLLGFWALVLSVKKSVKFFPGACFLLGIATHAYYSERIVALLFLFAFLVLNKKFFLKNIKYLIFGLVILGITQIPHLLLFSSGAFGRRLTQVNYFGLDSFLNNGGDLRHWPLGRWLFVVREFLSQYTAYLSPKNLFFDPDQQPARSMPDISVFYSYMIAPFIIGLGVLFRNMANFFHRLLLLIIVFGLIPAALTFDPFYTLRVLVFLWGIGLIISLGVNELFVKLNKSLFLGIGLFLSLASMFSLYKSGYVLTKYERSEVYGYSYIKLLETTDKYPNKFFIVDSPRDLGTGIRMAFFKRYDPAKLQTLLKARMKGGYYNAPEIDELYSVDNMEVRGINWEKDLCLENVILVGDVLAFSETQVKEHKLNFEFVIKDLTGETRLKAYSPTLESCIIK